MRTARSDRGKIEVVDDKIAENNQDEIRHGTTEHGLGGHPGKAL